MLYSTILADAFISRPLAAIEHMSQLLKVERCLTLEALNQSQALDVAT